MGRLPLDGDEVDIGGVTATVLQMEGRRIGWLRLTAAEPDPMT